MRTAQQQDGMVKREINLSAFPPLRCRMQKLVIEHERFDLDLKQIWICA